MGPGPERLNPIQGFLSIPTATAQLRASDYSEYQSDTSALFLPYLKPLYLTA